MSGGIKCWPEGERPREKLLQQGPSALSEAELLALIIGSGDAGSHRSALDLGRALLSEFGALRKLADASCAELQRVKNRARTSLVFAAETPFNRFRQLMQQWFVRRELLTTEGIAALNVAFGALIALVAGTPLTDHAALADAAAARKAG